MSIPATALAETETDLRHQRWAQAAAETMRRALTATPPGRFKIEVMVQGHFSDTTTYNQTHNKTLDAALAEVIRARLDSLLADALDLLAQQEVSASERLLRLALAAALSPTPTGDAK